MNVLENHLVSKLPPSVYYIPNFITEWQEEYLLQQVENAPKPKWTQLSNRRLQNWGGLPHPKGMVPEKLPKWLQDICEMIEKLGVFSGNKANHVLVNEYLPGQGIMPHEDGPLYFPVVSNLTLGSHGVLDFYLPHKIPAADVASDNPSSSSCPETSQNNHTSFEDRYMGSVLLERRSLFLMLDEMYTSHLHGITERKSDEIDCTILNSDKYSVEPGTTLDRGTRVSLTIRVVPKVLKLSLLGRK